MTSKCFLQSTLDVASPMDSRTNSLIHRSSFHFDVVCLESASLFVVSCCFKAFVFVIVVLLRLLATSSLDMDPHHMRGEEKLVCVCVFWSLCAHCCMAVLFVVDFRGVQT